MKLATLTLMLALVPAGLAQQAETQPQQPVVQKVFVLKYASADRIAKALEIFGGVKSDGTKILAVQGSPSTVAAIEEAIQKLDVPPEPAAPKPPELNVELTFHMILAGGAPDPQRKVPAELDGVVRNLTSLFGYKNFALVETAQFRVRSGADLNSTGVASWVPSSDQPGFPSTIYMLSARPYVTKTDNGYSISITRLRFSMRIPYATQAMSRGQNPTVQYQFRDAGINTEIDVRDGQKVVVGKANMDGSDGALVLVVTAKVVE